MEFGHVMPSLTNGDAATSIMWVLLNSWVIATLMHADPNAVKRAFVQAVLRCLFPNKAPAAFRLAGLQRGYSRRTNGAAVASINGTVVVGSGLLPDSEYFKPAKAIAWFNGGALVRDKPVRKKKLIH